MSLEAIKSGAIKRELESKEASEWTPYDVLLADKIGVEIPQGLMPKELFFLKLMSKDTAPGYHLLKTRKEASLWEEEAVNCIIREYRERWIDYYAKDESAIERSKQSKEALMKCFEAMLADKIHIVWNNVRTLLLALHLKDSDVDLINRANACVKKVHEHYAGDIPKDISEWFKDI